MYFLIYSEIGWHFFNYSNLSLLLSKYRRSFLILLDRAEKKGKVAKKFEKESLTHQAHNIQFFPPHIIMFVHFQYSEEGGGGKKTLKHWKINKDANTYWPVFRTTHRFGRFQFAWCSLILSYLTEKKRGGAKKILRERLIKMPAHIVSSFFFHHTNVWSLSICSWLPYCTFLSNGERKEGGERSIKTQTHKVQIFPPQIGLFIFSM